MTDAASGRVPPEHLEAEQSVIAECAITPEKLALVLTIVKPEMFFSPAHRHIFEAMVALWEADQPVDPIAIIGWLKDRDLEKAIGGAKYLHDLIATTAASAFVEAHAATVRDAWRLRRCAEVARAIAANQHKGRENVQEYLDRAAAAIAQVAEPPQSGTTRTFSELITASFTQIQHNAAAGQRLQGIETGFEKLDRIMAGWQRGQLYVLGARPGMGKTAMMMSTVTAIAGHQGKLAVPNLKPGEPHPVGYDRGVGVFSVEMGGELLSGRVLCAEARVDANKLRLNELSREDWDHLTLAASRCAPLPIVVDDDTSPSPIDLRAKGRRMRDAFEKQGRRLALLAIDYAQIVDGKAMVNAKASREQEVATIARKAKQLARDLDVPVLLLAQLKRLDVPKGQVPREPELSDLRESGALEQEADAVIFIHREEYYLKDKTPPEKRGLAKLIVAKQRNGPTGAVWVRFDGRYTLFSDLKPSQQEAPLPGFDDDEEDDDAA